MRTNLCDLPGRRENASSRITGDGSWWSCPVALAFRPVTAWREQRTTVIQQRDEEKKVMAAGLASGGCGGVRGGVVYDARAE